MAEFAGTPIRVTIPYKAANELGAYKVAIKDALTKLGCEACCSGHDIYFDTERNFRLDKGFNLSPLEGVTFAATFAQKPAHSILMDASLIADIDGVNKAIDTVAELAGCPGCHSGLDLFFTNRLNQTQLITYRNGL